MKNTEIEDIPQEKIAQTRKILDTSTHSHMSKNTEINTITGFCCICGEIPQKIVKHRLEDESGCIIRVERFCSTCFQKSGIAITPKVTKLIDTSGKNIAYAERDKKSHLGA
jgi:hypothetical protein